MRFLYFSLIIFSLTAAYARPVYINGQSLGNQTTVGQTGKEMLEVSLLLLMGIEHTSTARGFVLSHQGKTLEYDYSKGWLTAPDLAPVEQISGQSYVPIDALWLLGFSSPNNIPELLEITFKTSLQARPIFLRQNPIGLQTVVQDGVEYLPLAALLPLGAKYQASADGILFTLGSKNMQYSYGQGWDRAGLAAIKHIQGATYIPVDALWVMGFASNNSIPQLLDLATPEVIVYAARLNNLRYSTEKKREQEKSRVVLELSTPLNYSVQGNTITLPPIESSNNSQNLNALGIKSLAWNTTTQNTTFSLNLSQGAKFTVTPAADPPRLVIDVEYLDPNVPPAPKSYSTGVQHRDFGNLEMLIFDKSRFRPQVVSGKPTSVARFVEQYGAVAGINGGYFDPQTGIPVDMVVRNNQLLFGGLERRGAVGFLTSGDVLWGIPKARYTIFAEGSTFTVNAMNPNPRDNWLSCFWGDGKTVVGRSGFTTIAVRDGVVQQVSSTQLVPARGELAFSFQPEKNNFSKIPKTVGSAIQIETLWRDDAWQNAKDVLAAGPMLVYNQTVVLDGDKEGFDTSGSIWRATRQVAFGEMPSGDYVFAYMQWGTPEEFARTLQKVGVQHALRLDSGSSSSVYTGEGYLNAVWARQVPTAIVMKAFEIQAQAIKP